MTDLSKKPVAAATDVNDTDKASYWKQVLKNYKRRNASLERRRNALEERLRFIECILPSLLLSEAASTTYDGKRETSNESSNIPEFESVAQES